MRKGAIGAVAVVIGAAVLLAAGCGGDDEKPCEANGTGSVSIQNGFATQFEVLFNGVSHGVVNPTETEKFSVTSGSYTVGTEFVGGGVACTDFTVNVAECSKDGYVCAP